MIRPPMSLAIPTYEYHGKSRIYLERLFKTIYNQTFQDFSICVSDQSANDDVYDLCKEYKGTFDINYIRNMQRENPTENINDSLRYAQGDIVKVICMDDQFYKNESLEIIKESLDNDIYNWLFCGVIHFDEIQKQYTWSLSPSWNNQLLDGSNTLGGPTAIAYKKDCEQLFDGNLRMLVDLEMYYRMEKLHGMPMMIQDVLVASSISPEGAYWKIYNDTVRYNAMLTGEIAYCKEKHNAQ
jgi:glycosyltransferase involved in cell wall biosynthesis